MFSRVHEVKYQEIYPSGILKPSILLGYLEDIAAKNADSLGFGYEAISKNNQGWFLLKYAMEFDNYPQNISCLRVETEPRGANKLFAYRDFYFYDEKNFLIGKVASTWGLIDLVNKSMVSPLENFAGKMCPFEKKETDLKYNKIPAITEVSNEKIFDIRYDDIDVNQHVNNAIYLIWAFEVLPIEFKQYKKLKRLDINYKKEVKFGSKVLSQVQIVENETIHSIKNAESNEELCILSAIWE